MVGKESESTMSSYQEKLDAAKSIVVEHNENVEEADRIDFEGFVSNLKKIGGTTDKALVNCQWEDIESCGGEKKIPRLLAKQISAVFRKTKKSAGKKVITEKKASAMTTSELLEHYDPREKNPVWMRLYTLCEGNHCIVFDDDGSINVDASAELIDEIREGYEPRDVYLLNGRPYKIHNIGDRVDSFVDENPLYPGKPLRGSSQTCDVSTRSWKDVPHNVRVALRLALDTGELKITQLGDIHDVLDKLVGKTEEEQHQFVSGRYIQAALRYQELEKEGKLPRLKLKRGQKALRVSKKQDPFFGSRGHKTY